MTNNGMAFRNLLKVATEPLRHDAKIHLRESCHGDLAFMSNTLAFLLDPLKLTKCVGLKITLPATRARHDGDILNDQQIPAPAVAPRNLPDPRSTSSANVTCHVWFSTLHGL